MAKAATGTKKNSSGGGRAGATSRKPSQALATSPARTQRTRSAGADGGFGEALAKLLQSPLVADLLAVAATAALAALAEHGFSNRGAPDGASGKRAGRAVKEAGKAAAAAIGRRIGNEFEEIRSAAREAKARAAG